MNVVVIVANLYESEINLHNSVNVVFSVNNAVLELKLAVFAERISSGRKQTVCLARIDINGSGFYSTVSVNVVIVAADLDQTVICAQNSVDNISQSPIQGYNLRIFADYLLNTVFIEQIESLCIGGVLLAINIACADISVLIKAIYLAVNFLQLKSVDGIIVLRTDIIT